ncbi:MAG: nitroreductase family protein [Rickettsiales bacterium]|jgi:hypothetical protein|nr:nitroreductase family protein [Rickettsiales bacterium]
MRKIFCVFCLLFLLKPLQSFGAEIKFGNVKGGENKPLMKALAERKTDRIFSKKPISDELQGKILWAAAGVNRKNGKKTVPFARNVNDILLYVLRSDGVWLYNPENNAITQISADGIEEDGIIKLVFVSNSEDYVKNGIAQMHAGSMYQNAALVCASEGLGNVVEGMFNEKDLTKKLQLKKGEKIIITQKIGWVK